MSKLQDTQKMIASRDFHYGGDSWDIMDIVNAIKRGYRLCKVDDVFRKIDENSYVMEYDEAFDLCKEWIKEATK